MGQWVLRGISAAGEGEYAAHFKSGDDERTFRFTVDYIGKGEKRVLAFEAADFEKETLYSRDTARAVVEAVSAFHKATAGPVLFALPGEPPER
ncbi:hypothetical protein [Actinoplanes sp. NBRC 103695]|uniref:hypothetical protein n=1 Tax=Actinoplanes sp. NBRC 103695 TaxID=3032202 RepID=UPI0024A59B29|nr:hypothetical protein [Actinoplanes sp. NBRC 103695]GLY96841.1 hypothetical protein Acsp02_40950 [Actinoplanes sp. NBRC 103695]